MNKKLEQQISNKLEQLEKAVEKIRNTVINSKEEETWDIDHYSGLQSKLETALELLKDKLIAGKLNEYGDPIILGQGLLTLLDEWNEAKENDDQG